MKEIIIKLNRPIKPTGGQQGNLKIHESPDDLIQSQPEEFGSFEEKLRQFEAENPDEITQMARTQGPMSTKDVPYDTPEPTEKEKDPVYDFLLRVIHGEIPESDLKKYAKGNCNKCHGRGKTGHQKGPEGNFTIPVVCGCVTKKVKSGEVKL